MPSRETLVGFRHLRPGTQAYRSVAEGFKNVRYPHTGSGALMREPQSLAKL